MKLFENATPSAPAEGQVEDSAENVEPMDTGNEPSTQEEGGTDGAENLILGKFKSQADLEKAYRNLESFNTKNAQELAKLRKEAMSPPQGQEGQRQVPATRQGEDVNARFTQMFIDNPLDTIQAVIGSMMGNQLAPIKQQTQEHQLKLDMASMGAKYGDFYSMGDQIAEVFKASPNLWSMPNALEIAYKVAKADYGANAIKQARDAGRNEAVQTLQQKRGLTAEGQEARAGSDKSLSDTDQLKLDILRAGKPSLFHVE